MFDSLTGRLGDVFDRLTKQGTLSESDINDALRDVRVALLEADVALPVVKDFVTAIKDRALGQEVLKSVAPGQMVIKIVHEHLVEMLGSEDVELNLNAVPPVVFMLVGLQGSGKTTSTAKIAMRLGKHQKKKVLMASLDVQRPAAQEQLRVLGEQAEVATLPIIPGQMPVDIAERAISAGKLGGYDVVMLDTAGRLHVDEALMAELEAVRRISVPQETLLVADALTGQDAVNVATEFNTRMNLTGIVLTRVDGDGRGGAALSMRAVTGCPIKLMGVGEKLDEMEVFHPDRIASRILGMGDVVSLVEKAAESIEIEEAEKLAAKMKKGTFDLADMSLQLGQLRKLGGMEGILAMLPGMGKMKSKVNAANIDENMITRQQAIISSMTLKERTHPKLVAASRKRRIAAGSGTTVQDVNRLLKQHKQMAQMMKKMSKMGTKGLMRNGMPGMPGLMPPH